MDITIIMIGKSFEGYINEGFQQFISRLKHYVNIETIIIPEIKDRRKLTPDQIKSAEAKSIVSQIPSSSLTVLLDEKGVEFSSIEFANFIQKQFNSGSKKLVFIIGGAYGVSDELKKRSNYISSFSRMTFTHQFIRLILAEQLYRAMTILKNEPYHNE